MRRRIFALALLFVIPAASVMTTLAQRTGRARNRTSARASLSGPLASLFPADTFVYVELSDLASAAEEMGGVDALYTLVNRAAAAEMTAGKSDRLPFTLAQFRAALGSSMALGVILPAKFSMTNAQSIDPIIVGVVRAPTPEGAELLRQIAEEVPRARSGTRRPTVQTIGGARIVTVNEPNPKNSYSIAVVDGTVVFGTPAGVRSLLAPQKGAAAARLSDVPGFAGASNRVPGKRQVFAFLNGAPMVRGFNEGVDASFKATGKPGTQQAEKPEAAALKAFLGLDALVGGSFSALAESGNMTMQVAVELDRSNGGLVAVLSDAPPIAVRAAALLPSNTDLLVANSVDAVAIHDLLLRVITPAVAKAMGMPPPPEAIATAEKAIGMRLRDEFLAAFGNEVAIGMWIDDGQPLALVSDDAPKQSTKGVALFELRNPEAIEAALTKVFASEAGEAPVKEAYKDVPVWRFGTMTYAVVGGFGVIGDTPDVSRVIDAAASNTTLSTNEAYVAAAGAVPNNAIFATYVSPRFFEYSAKTIEPNKKLPGSMLTSPVFFTIQKDSSGIYGNFQVPLPNLRLWLEGEKPTDVGRR